MRNIRSREIGILVLGDIAALFLALMIGLLVRYKGAVSWYVFVSHLGAFFGLFVLSLGVFLIVGLYENHNQVFRMTITRLILLATVTNAIIAIAYFYFVPFFAITPKSNLVIYMVLSAGLLFAWRVYINPMFYPSRKLSAVILGNAPECNEIRTEIASNPRYALEVVPPTDISKASFVVADFGNTEVLTMMPTLYDHLLKTKVEYVDARDFYEEVFDKVPLSLLDNRWFVTHLSMAPRYTFDILKRAMDIVCAGALGVIAIIIHPLVVAAIRLDDGGPVFIYQERLGQGGKIIRIPKYRSMTGSDGGKWLTKDDTRHTKVGAFLRKSRIDELPQLWSVLRGDLSLIGPRPDIVNLGRELESAIPHYSMRYTVKPGLSGWAQISQAVPPQSVEESRIRFAYDIYYVKNRSLFLDLRIAMRTIKTLLSRVGM